MCNSVIYHPTAKQNYPCQTCRNYCVFPLGFCVSEVSVSVLKADRKMCVRMCCGWMPAPPTTEFTKIQTHMLTEQLSYHYSILCERVPQEVFCVVDFKLTLNWVRSVKCNVCGFCSSKPRNPPYNLGVCALRHF